MGWRGVDRGEGIGLKVGRDESFGTEAINEFARGGEGEGEGCLLTSFTQGLHSGTTSTDGAFRMHRRVAYQKKYPLSMVNTNANQRIHKMSRHSRTKTRVHELS